MTRSAILLAVAAAAAGNAAAEFRKAEHPFMLWDRQSLAALRKRVQEEPWARAELERIGADKDGSSRAAHELLLLAATGDPVLAEAERKKLLRVLASPIPRGGAQWLTVLRYDLLHDRLTDAERKGFEEFARTYIRNAIFENAVFNPEIFNDSAKYSRYDARKYTRTNWLPNIIWPRKVSANLLALALRDEELIRRTWAHYGSWKWYFDEYLGDVGFYSEEFSKMGSTPGAMLVYCLAAERCGLDELGFGYRGTGGATMRGHIASLLHLGYPRVQVGSDRPHYPMVTMGDLRQMGSSQAYTLPSPAFQHALVMGYAPDGTGGNLRFRAHGAWGGEVRGQNPQWDGYGGFTPKMQLPLWFELGAMRWPQDGYAYFLAQMRPPGENVYTPSLWFGLGPIDPAKAAAPPAPSAAWPQRGLLMLRADPSPAYWESSAPAVAMRTAGNYAHNVNDAFALLGYYALNRPIYLNRQTCPSYAMGWSRSVQSHCAVRVDDAEPRFTDATTIRHAFAPAVQFAAATSDGVYEGITLTRALMLRREYLLDVTRLAAAEGEHDYTWIVHALGRLRDAEKPLAGHPDKSWEAGDLPPGLDPLRNVRRLDAGAQPWAATIDQVCTLADPSQAKLPASWYARGVGVRVHMLAQPETTVFAADTPPVFTERREGKEKVRADLPSEVGGATLLARRCARGTTFTAVHEPFQGGTPRITRVRALGESSGGVYLAVTGPDWEDRLAVSLAGDADTGPCGFAGGGENLRFVDFACLRLAGGKVDITTRELIALKLKLDPAGPAGASPELVVNGKETPARLEGGLLLFGKDNP